MKLLLVLAKKCLAVDVSKIGKGPAKRYSDSRCVIILIDEQGGEIGRLHQTIQNDTKDINIISDTTGGIGQDLHNMVKDMEYYAAKLHQVEKSVEVSNIFYFGSFS